MATYDAQVPSGMADVAFEGERNDGTNLSTTTYVMRAQSVAALPSVAYLFWDAPAPDPTGAYYSGSGLPTMPVVFDVIG
jgi:hypothetical protein